jgi:hypothetical protein
MLSNNKFPRFTDSERQHIQKIGWIDSFDLLKEKPLNITCWTGTRVDYIFIYQKQNKLPLVNSSVFVTDVSDHFPVFIDIAKQYHNQDIKVQDEKSQVNYKYGFINKGVIEYFTDSEQQKIKQQYELWNNSHQSNTVNIKHDNNFYVVNVSNNKIFNAFTQKEYKLIVSTNTQSNQQTHNLSTFAPIQRQETNLATFAPIQRQVTNIANSFTVQDVKEQDLSNCGRVVTIEEFTQDYYKYSGTDSKNSKMEFFNGQPPTELSANWFDLLVIDKLKLHDKYNKGFNDPYLTGNSKQTLTLGSGGIYLTTTVPNTFLFIKTSNNFNNLVDNTTNSFYNFNGIIYNFAFNNNINNNNFKIFKLDRKCLRENYPEQIDKMYDLIYFEPIKSEVPVFKITSKSSVQKIHPYLRVNNVYVHVVNLNNVNEDEEYDDEGNKLPLVKNIISYALNNDNDNIYGKILTLYYASLFDIKQKKIISDIDAKEINNIKMQIEQIMKNRKNMKINFNNIFNIVKKYKYSSYESDILVELFKLSNLIGGNTINYYEKYMKYKAKYLALIN